MKKKICFITGSRSEYGLLSNLIKICKTSKKFKTYLIVTGSHFSKKFGNTVREINKDGIKIDFKINLKNLFETKKNIIFSFSKSMLCYHDYLNKINPDVVVLLGDRHEIFSAAIVCMFLGIPIAHIHGGEVTEGSYDDNIRHSITKLSHYHFVANKTFKKRVVQLGENSKSTFVVGGLGVDNIKKYALLSKQEIQKLLKIKFQKYIFLITFHPATLSQNDNLIIFKNLIKNLNQINNTDFIFTFPSADVGNLELIQELKKFKKKNKNVFMYKSLGNIKYLSLLRHANLLLGNSSSGLSEAPTFKIPVINIGDRQKGRLFAKNIIHSNGSYIDLKKAIRKSLSKNFLNEIKNTINPYGSGGSQKRIFKILSKINFSRKIIKKKFYDLNIL
jgi:GDP/UDP-N,N'-diacetylbacillosamine 2-epimerase (hydrolysing)